MHPAISIIVVEDNLHLREEFERMISTQPGLRWIGGAGSLAEARELMRQAQPEVAVIDLGLPDGDGTVLIAELAARMPPVAALVTTVFGDEAHVIRAIEAGARGYLLKDSSPEEFVRAIELVHQGGAPLSPHIAKHLLARLVPAAPTDRGRLDTNADADALTPREIDILTSISQGFTVNETAEQLHISAHTVATHIKNIYSKLAVKNRMQAINQARLRGFIR